MILVDTSVWIDFFKNTLFPQEKVFFISHLEQQNIVTTDVIFAELFQGARNKEEISLLTEYLDALEVQKDENIWIDAGKLSQSEKLLSFGVGLPDVTILLTAKRKNLVLWTRDKKLRRVAEKLNVEIL